MKTFFRPWRKGPLVAVRSQQALDNIIVQPENSDIAKQLEVNARRRDKALMERMRAKFAKKDSQKRPFFLLRPIIALFRLIFRGLGIAMPVQNVEEVHMAKDEKKDKKVKVSLPSLFSWEGLVARLGFAGAILVAVFCVVAAGITFWNYYAGAAFIVLCGCLPAVVIAGIAGYMGVQKMMNQREESDDGKE